jgi:hypothetical protein
MTPAEQEQAIRLISRSGKLLLLLHRKVLAGSGPGERLAVGMAAGLQSFLEELARQEGETGDCARSELAEWEKAFL